MDILADENLHPIVIQRLRDAGHIVEAIIETMPGTDDTEILQRSDIGKWIFVTFDRDFGELIFHRDYPRPAAVIYSRLGRAEPRHVADIILQLLDSQSVEGLFIALTKKGIKMTPYPDGV